MVMFITMKTFNLRIFAYILEWDFFFQDWSFSFFLNFHTLEHLCTWRDMFMPFGPFSAERAKIASYLVHPGNAFRLPKSSNLKQAQRKEYNNLHALTCPFAEFSLLHIVDFIIKTIEIAHIQPINCKYSKDLS